MTQRVAYCSLYLICFISRSFLRLLEYPSLRAFQSQDGRCENGCMGIDLGGDGRSLLHLVRPACLPSQEHRMRLGYRRTANRPVEIRGTNTLHVRLLAALRQRLSALALVRAASLRSGCLTSEQSGGYCGITSVGRSRLARAVASSADGGCDTESVAIKLSALPGQTADGSSVCASHLKESSHNDHHNLERDFTFRLSLVSTVSVNDCSTVFTRAASCISRELIS